MTLGHNIRRGKTRNVRELLSKYVRKVGASARGIGHEVRGGYRLTADVPSFLRFATDVVLSRIVRHLPLASGLSGNERTIRVRGGIELRYRLNRGDMQSIREVWIDEAYRLPFDVTPKLVVDLGANIGLTSLWLAHRYGCTTIVAVEPQPENARLARLNLARNNIEATVVEAAVGTSDCTVYFKEEADSNLGHVATSGRPVRQVSMDTVLGNLPPGAEVDLIKMDIEGGEGPLLEDNLDWLRRVRSIIAETHRDVIDHPAMVRTLESHGFRYIPAHSLAEFDCLDGFLRAA
jgi:FkbM family methyltransferase